MPHILDPNEFDLVKEAVTACAGEQKNQLAGRKFMKLLIKEIHKEMDKGTPMYTILVGLWVTIHTLSEEWRNNNGTPNE